MGELRDEIVADLLASGIQIGRDAFPDNALYCARAIADRILALPQIVEALRVLHQRRGDMAMVKIDENLRAALDPPISTNTKG